MQLRKNTTEIILKITSSLTKQRNKKEKLLININLLYLKLIIYFIELICILLHPDH